MTVPICHWCLVMNLIDETLMNIISGFQKKKKKKHHKRVQYETHVLQTELNKITEGYKLIISSKSFQVTENLPLSDPASKKGFNWSQRAHKHTRPVS